MFMLGPSEFVDGTFVEWEICLRICDAKMLVLAFLLKLVESRK